MQSGLFRRVCNCHVCVDAAGDYGWISISFIPWLYSTCTWHLGWVIIVRDRCWWEWVKLKWRNNNIGVWFTENETMCMRKNNVFFLNLSWKSMSAPRIIYLVISLFFVFRLILSLLNFGWIISHWSPQLLRSEWIWLVNGNWENLK